MQNIDKRLAALRREIDLLKSARQVTFDANRQHQIYVRLSTCILESIRLIEQRIQEYNPQKLRGQRAAQHTQSAPHEPR